MIKQLTATDYPQTRPLFASDYLTLMIDSVIAGSSSGQLWADDPTAPQTALLWDGAHSLYLVGQAANPATNEQLAELLAIEITVLARQRGIEGFKIFYSDPAWESQIGVIFPTLTLTQHPRVVYTLGQIAQPDWQSRLPAGYAIRPIDRTLLSDSTLGNHADLMEEIESCWPSQERFLTRGFGACAVGNGEIICRCTAEYVSAGKCGIGIATAETYRRQGFAVLTASAFLADCVNRGIVPYWDAWLRNQASVATAEKIGLRRLQEYNIYWSNLS
jgi:RimJ/RimL family protein N-acetyltransferase